MLKLAFDREPFWLDMVPGVRVHDAGGGEVALDHAGWDHLKPA